MRKLSVFAMLTLLLVGVLAIAVQGASVPVSFGEIEVNGHEAGDGTILGDTNTGDTLEFEVELEATGDADNVRLAVSIPGYEYEDLEDETSLFDVEADRTYHKTLSIDLPNNMDKGTYTVHVDVTDRDNDRVSTTFTIDVGADRHDLGVEDVLFSPGTTVKAGRSLLASVRVENSGEKDEDDVKVSFSIPELGVSDADYIEEIETDEEKMSEELFVRVPECAAAGEYTGRVSVEYDEGTRTATEDFTITVLANDNCAASGDAAGKTVITAGPESQNIVAGAGEAVYPLALTNAGSESRTYTITATAGSWATTRVSSSVLVVGAGETKVTNVFVAASEDAAGENMFNVVVMSGDETLQDIALTANVVDADSSPSLKRALEVGLVVLVVLLVIVGLIVGFSRLKGDDSEKDEETYY